MSDTQGRCVILTNEVIRMNEDFILSKEKQSFSGGTTECPICGKIFYVPSGTRKEYVYKKVNRQGVVRFTCSNKCYTKLCDYISSHRWSR